MFNDSSYIGLLTVGGYSADGTWKAFSGDQLGTLLAARTLDLYKLSRRPISECHSSSYVQMFLNTLPHRQTCDGGFHG